MTKISHTQLTQGLHYFIFIFIFIFIYYYYYYYYFFPELLRHRFGHNRSSIRGIYTYERTTSYFTFTGASPYSVTRTWNLRRNHTCESVTSHSTHTRNRLFTITKVRNY